MRTRQLDAVRLVKVMDRGDHHLAAAHQLLGGRAIQAALDAPPPEASVWRLYIRACRVVVITPGSKRPDDA